ncbi:hypothetical protein [Comamonas terrigena]|uniref:hypothetical protein n=1 Tax=Comamonas terrigena TaxID=32013 RepID=UPI002355BDFD|nr:hypothetical protein [Comamonas terrigena]
MNFEVKPEVLIAALETDDDIGAVLRAHLQAEEFLNWYLSERIQGDLATYVKPPRDFGGKLSTAAALGLPLEFAGVAHQLNNIRNKLAHRIDGLNPSHVQQFGRDVEKLVAIDPGFIPLKGRNLELCVKNPGQLYTYGDGNARLDLGIASFAFLGVAMRWSVALSNTTTAQS